MAKKDFSFTSKLLMTLLGTGDRLLLNPRELRRRLFSGKVLGEQRRASQIIYYLHKKGLIKYVDQNNQRFVKLTAQGELQALLAKARTAPALGKWDGKWRVIIFDIPEDSNSQRNFFRYLLKHNGYVRLQGSVYISPYPMNREAISYLKQKKLMDYIRFLKVEEIDDDRDLRKQFGLNKQ